MRKCPVLPVRFGCLGWYKRLEVLAFSDVVTFTIDSNNKITIGKDKEIQKADVKYLALDFLQGNHPTYKSDPDYFTKEFPLVGIVRVSLLPPKV